MQGTVKWFNDTKGYGFIKPDDAKRDVFVHISELQKANIDELRENDRVEFDMGLGKNGKETAVNLRPVQ